ncbi:MAG: radical SAM protein [Nitrospiraceae bacterium]|nr:radical SAM protein [Nitrospiraceae bacterium]
MRILLISANREPFPEPVFPIGLAYVAGSLERSGVEVRIFDMRHGSTSSLQKEITRFRPDRIGISLRNVDNAAYPFFRFYLPSYLTLIQSVRAVIDVPVVLGGSAFSLFPEEINAYLKADGGLKGDGEGFYEFLCSEGEGKIATAERCQMETIGFPKNIAGVFPDFRRYRTIGIQTARGCANRCIYCSYPFLEGRSRRTRPPERIVEEIASLHRNFSVTNFFVVDSLFNGEESHMVQVLDRLAALNLRVRISCYLQPKISDPSIFRLMKKAGCVVVDFGTDSGSSSLLSSLRKPFTTDDIRAVSRACRQEGIDHCHSLIFGGPGETESTIQKTVDLMDEVSPRAVIAMTGIRIYPFTEMEQIALNEGIISRGDSLFEPRFYFPKMGQSLLREKVRRAVAGRNNWFFPGEKDWSASWGYRLLGFFYRKGPLWRTFRQ